MKELSLLNRHCHVLLIDDDEDDYILTREMLDQSREVKFSLRWASNFAEGYRELESNNYDVVLVDYDLGPHNGLELVRIFVGRRCRAPFILVTGRGSYEVDVEAMQAGVVDYLTKSELNSLLLERSIRYAQERKHTEEELEERVRERTRELAQALAELRENEEKLRMLVNSAQVVLWGIDKNGIVTAVEGRGISITPYDSNSLVGRSMYELIGRNDELLYHLERAFAGEEVTMIGPAVGNPAEMVERMISPNFNDQGEITSITVVSTLITDRVKAEEMARQQNLRTAALAEISRLLASDSRDYQKVMEIIVKGVAEWIGDACMIHLFNEDQTALMRASVYHTDPHMLELLKKFTLNCPYVNDDSPARRVVTTEKPLFLPQLTKAEFRSRIKPEYHPMLADLSFYAINVVPMWFQGKVIGSLGVARTQPGKSYTDEDTAFLRDLADRAALAIQNAQLFTALQKELANHRRTESELRASQALFAGMFEAAPDATLLISPDGTILRANRQVEKVFGYSPEELTGKHFEILIPEYARSNHLKRHREYLDSPDPNAMVTREEYNALHRDGSEVKVEITLSPYDIETGRHVICAIRRKED